MKSIYDKKLSAGVIVRDPVTRLILACFPTGKNKMSADLPKGQCNPKEFAIDAAVRELYEETGLAIDKIELKDLGKYPYVKTKDLHLFYTEREVDLKSLECKSMFVNSNDGKMLPEICGYSMIDVDNERWYPALKKVIQKSLSENSLID